MGNVTAVYNTLNIFCKCFVGVKKTKHVYVPSDLHSWAGLFMTFTILRKNVEARKMKPIIFLFCAMWKYVALNQAQVQNMCDIPVVRTSRPLCLPRITIHFSGILSQGRANEWMFYDANFFAVHSLLLNIHKNYVMLKLCINRYVLVDILFI